MRLTVDQWNHVKQMLPKIRAADVLYARIDDYLWSREKNELISIRLTGNQEQLAITALLAYQKERTVMEESWRRLIEEGRL